MADRTDAARANRVHAARDLHRLRARPRARACARHREAHRRRRVRALGVDAGPRHPRRRRDRSHAAQDPHALRRPQAGGAGHLPRRPPRRDDAPQLPGLYRGIRQYARAPARVRAHGAGGRHRHPVHRQFAHRRPALRVAEAADGRRHPGGNPRQSGIQHGRGARSGAGVGARCANHRASAPLRRIARRHDGLRAGALS